MKVLIEREGGFAGTIRRFEVDAQMLPAADLRQVEEAVAAARFFDLPSRLEPSALGAAQGADRFLYRVTVESSGRRHTVEADEANLGDELRSLIDQVRKLSGKKGPPHS